jgi:Tol biopolymer transport system component
MSFRRCCALLSVSLVLVAPASAQWAAHPFTWRVSEPFPGFDSDGVSGEPSVGEEGRYVAFSSNATNLIPPDSNGSYDVFRYDRQTETMELVSRAGSSLANGDSLQAAMTPDGKFIVFSSNATNFPTAPSHPYRAVYSWTPTATSPQLVHVFGAGAPIGDCIQPDVSDDGTRVVFATSAANVARPDTNGLFDIVRVLGFLSAFRVTEGINGEPDGNSLDPCISGDGNTIAFESFATNLVNDDTNGQRDVFVRFSGQSIERVSVAADGTQANGPSANADLSADGRYVVFESTASNLVPNDTNGRSDIFWVDRQTGEIRCVSKSMLGVPTDGHSVQPSISADGSIVAFASFATNMVYGDTNGVEDVFLVEVSTGAVFLRSLGQFGEAANGNCHAPSLSPDAHFVGFASSANTFTQDGNGLEDVFLRGRILTFDPGNPVLIPDQPFDFTCYPGRPDGLALLFVTAVNGQPFFSHVATGRFDDVRGFQLSGRTPPDLSGLSVSLQVFGEAENGRIEPSNGVDLLFH